jgi:hypothetical protein
MSAMFELNLLAASGGQYIAHARYSAPGYNHQASTAPFAFAYDRLRASDSDPERYGQMLSATLFSDPALAGFWQQVQVAAQQQLAVRVRLNPADPGLHLLRWETLRDPKNDQPFALQQGKSFARILESADLQKYTAPPRPEELTALVAIAAPGDLTDYGLHPIDADGELARIRAALGHMPITVLGDVAGAAGRADLATIQAKLNDRPALVVLVAHGNLRAGEAAIYLEDQAGKTSPIEGKLLVDAFAQQKQRPALLILVSCNSAGDDYAALSALGPRLAQTGLPAVLAFQGNIAMAATKRLLPMLMSELLRDGAIDRALAAARAQLGANGPWWQPVLFLRGEGQLWQGAAADTAPTTKLSPEEQQAINEQIKRLELHRQTLAHYLNQVSMVGEANVRPETSYGIRSARREIKRIKEYLAGKGIEVAGHPDDEAA